MKQLYDTGDMGLAVALVCVGHELVELEKPASGNGRVTFRFLSNPAIHRVAQDYWSGKLLIDAKLHWNETKNVKTRLYSQS